MIVGRVHLPCCILSSDILQNVVGSFILPGSRTVPFVYTVETIQEGRSYAARTVKATTLGSDEICFSCTCSFKKAETGLLDVQEKVDLWETYREALQGKWPQDFEETPGVDIPWFWDLRKRTGNNDEFPGLQYKKADMEAYNKRRHPLDRRQLMFYRALGPLPPDPNMHICAHLYASDRNGLYIIANHLDAGDLYTSMGSLVHMTIIHSPMKDLWFGPSQDLKYPMDDSSEDGRWFAKEDWTTRASPGRVVAHSRLWSADGTHVATLMQDGMVRLSKKAVATEEEIATIEQRKSSWKPRAKV